MVYSWFHEGSSPESCGEKEEARGEKKEEIPVLSHTHRIHLSLTPQVNTLNRDPSSGSH